MKAPGEPDAVALMGDLVRTVSRMFYEDCHVVILDIMLEHLILEEEDLADRMKVLPRELNKMAVRLRDDKILSAETLSDMKDDGRQVTTTKFFLDFRTIRDVLKYKIYTMSQRLERRLRETETTLGFGCSECKSEYSILDAQSFLTERFTFECPSCRAELEEKKGKGEKEAVSSTFSAMMEEVTPIIARLKEIDQHGIPEMSKGKILFPQVNKEKLKRREGGHGPPIGPERRLEDLRRPAARDEEALEAEEEKELISLDRGEKNRSDSCSEVLTVAGAEKRFSDVTEEDKELMTEEEYERYFEIYERTEEHAA